MPAAATSCSMWARRSRKVVVRDASWPTRGRAIHRRDRRRGRVSSGRVRERTVRPADVRRRRTSRRVTDTGTGVSFRRLHQQRAAMGAQIGQCRQFAGGAAQDDDRLPAEVGGEESPGAAASSAVSTNTHSLRQMCVRSPWCVRSRNSMRTTAPSPSGGQQWPGASCRPAMPSASGSPRRSRRDAVAPGSVAADRACAARGGRRCPPLVSIAARNARSARGDRQRESVPSVHRGDRSCARPIRSRPLALGIFRNRALRCWRRRRAHVGSPSWLTTHPL